ncbi:hypothetical protein [Elioraea sp.]|uniref:hypothetical protein n=1 Tax=Elioraea sp. TaxID=2185103 RepID=UPI003F6FA1AC
MRIPGVKALVLGAALGLAAWSGPSAASPLTLTAAPPVLTGTVDYDFDVAGGFGVIFGAVDTLTLPGGAEAVFGLLDIDGLFDPGTLGANAVATLAVFEIASSVSAGLDFFLVGDLLEFEVGTGVIGLLFGNLFGEGAALFGDHALVLLRDASLPGALSGLATIEISAVAAQAIPLPSSASLLLAALALLGFARARATAS